MNKGDFVGGIEVREVGSKRVMTLGGTADNWVCTWLENGLPVSARFKPEQLEPVSGGSTPS